MKSPILTIYSESSVSCASACTEKAKECLSFSYNNITGICKLSDKDPSDEPAEVTSSPGSTLMAKGDVWVGFKSSWYLFSLQIRSWDNAKLDCESKGANLVKVETNDEHQFLRTRLEAMTFHAFWIGARYNAEEGQHLWVDGTTMLFDGWAPGRQGTAQGCVDYLKGGLVDWKWLWNTHGDCTKPLLYICEKGR